MWAALIEYFTASTQGALRALKSWSWKRWCVAIFCALGALILTLTVDIPSTEELRAYSHHMGMWFPAAFWLAYTALTMLPLPRTLWTVSAGILFGPVIGCLISISALTASACCTVLALRLLVGAPHGEQGLNGRALTLHRHIAQRGWVSVLGLRMVAGVPFSLLNYVCAISPIPLGKFLFATALGSIPTTVLGTIAGNALVEGGSPWLLAALIGCAAVGLAIVVKSGLRI